jgi:hypothetical protein
LNFYLKKGFGTMAKKHGKKKRRLIFGIFLPIFLITPPLFLSFQFPDYMQSDALPNDLRYLLTAMLGVGMLLFLIFIVRFFNAFVKNITDRNASDEWMPQSSGKCLKCGNTLSSDADRCPSCHTLTATGKNTKKRNEFKCQCCEATLEYDKHVRENYYSYIRNGNTESGTSFTQVPCSKCGEPEPYYWHAVAGTWIKIFIVGAVLFVIILIGIASG